MVILWLCRRMSSFIRNAYSSVWEWWCIILATYQMVLGQNKFLALYLELFWYNGVKGEIWMSFWFLSFVTKYPCLSPHFCHPLTSSLSSPKSTTTSPTFLVPFNKRMPSASCPNYLNNIPSNLPIFCLLPLSSTLYTAARTGNVNNSVAAFKLFTCWTLCSNESKILKRWRESMWEQGRREN